MHNYESQIELINLKAIIDFSSHMYKIGTCVIKMKFTWNFLIYWIIWLVWNILD